MNEVRGRAASWSSALLANPVRAAGYPKSIAVDDGMLGGLLYRTLAIVPDPSARYSRARRGEFGLEEGLALTHAIRSMPADAALLSVVDVPGQAFGKTEEAAGLHLALASAVDAYIEERQRGRPILSLVVGKAISGAFLAHGLQAGWIGALDDTSVEVHVMSAASVARVTRSSSQEVSRIASIIVATARDVKSFASFGAIDECFIVADPDAPSPTERDTVGASIDRARRAGLGTRAPVDRLTSPAALESRALARAIRDRIDREW